MNKMPASWTACSLGDIVERIETGKSVKCDERPPRGLEKGLVKISAVTWGEFNENESKTLFDSAHLKPEEKIQLGDFLISRANTLELVGSCVLVKKLSKNLYLSDKVLRLVLPDEAKPWLLVCLRSQNGRKQIESLATGNQLSMRNISQQALRDIQMPLPPLAEQTRIAAKLDELLAQVDTLKARIDGIPALLKRFRQSVLAAAVSGRLTEEWRVQKSLGSPATPSPSKHSLRMEELAAFAALHDLPQGWACASAADICSSVRDGTHDTPAYRESGVPLVTSKNIGSGFVNTTEAKLISREDHFEISKRSRVEPGDVLFSMIGTVGNCCVAREQDGEFSIKNVGLFKKNESAIVPRYLEFWLNSQVMWAWLGKNLKGSSQKFASLGTLRALPIFLPSLQEQTEIVRRVEQLFAFADQLETRVKAAQTRIDLLTQSILAKAFRGELVPQDPNDEPASVLLERIKAQRAAAPKAKRGKKASA